MIVPALSTGISFLLLAIYSYPTRYIPTKVAVAPRCKGQNESLFLMMNTSLIYNISVNLVELYAVEWLFDYNFCNKIIKPLLSLVIVYASIIVLSYGQ